MKRHRWILVLPLLSASVPVLGNYLAGGSASISKVVSCFLGAAANGACMSFDHARGSIVISSLFVCTALGIIAGFILDKVESRSKASK